MKLPETIRLNGIDFAVELHDNLNDGVKILYGDVDYGLARIRLNPIGQNHQRLCVTLWHEIFHAVCEMNSIDLGADTERVIDAFSFATYQLLQDNGNKLFDLQESGGDLNGDT